MKNSVKPFYILVRLFNIKNGVTLVLHSSSLVAPRDLHLYRTCNIVKNMHSVYNHTSDEFYCQAFKLTTDGIYNINDGRLHNE